jgi:hypothetical protein
MKAISIRQPWAWLIIHGGKDIENRDWSTKFRGRVLIHASKALDRNSFTAAASMVHHVPLNVVVPLGSDMQRGGIIGSVEIVDCVSVSTSPWFFGKFGFVLRNPIALPFRPCRGLLGFFDVPEVVP